MILGSKNDCEEIIVVLLEIERLDLNYEASLLADEIIREIVRSTSIYYFTKHSSYKAGQYCPLVMISQCWILAGYGRLEIQTNIVPVNLQVVSRALLLALGVYF